MPRASQFFASLVPAAVCAAALLMPSAQAAEHALIMTIGNYIKPEANLPGIDKDAALARRIALSMGVPAANVTELRDQELTRQGISSAMERLAQRVQAGDGVFIYYSGHGGQIVANRTNKKCTEGLVSHDLQLFEDEQLERSLQQIASRAGRVVMMNDSCFSGGAASTKSMDDVRPKTARIGAGEDPDYACGQAVNAKAFRSLFSEPRPANLLYIAAASDREVAFATNNGSTATVAWSQCLAAADRDRNGVLSGEEIRACAQQIVNNSGGRRQTISLTGNPQLGLGFVAAANAAQPVDAAAGLEAIRQAASSAIAVELQVARNQMRINQDELDFSVASNKAGYLYVFHVGSDGKTFDLLFPNRADPANRIEPGTQRMPRASWRVKAGGPAGTSYLLAVVTETERNFSELMKGKAGPFSQTGAVNQSTRNLYAEATGAERPNPGRYGASRVVAVREVN